MFFEGRENSVLVFLYLHIYIDRKKIKYQFKRHSLNSYGLSKHQFFQFFLFFQDWYSVGRPNKFDIYMF